MWRVGRIGALVGACFVFNATPLRADEAGGADRGRLPALLRKGSEAAKAKQWEVCVQALGEAAAIEDSPRTAGDLGLCEEQAGRFVEAHRHLRRSLEGAPSGSKGEPWKSYQAGLGRVAERVAVLFVTVTPPEAAVLLDGRPIGKADGRHIAVAPGTHTLAARLDGHEDATETRTMRARDVPHVHLALKPKPKPKPSPAASPPAAGVHVAAGAPAASAVGTGPLLPVPSGPARPPFACLPGPGARGLVVPLACLGGALLLTSSGGALAFEVHATSLRDALIMRGFRLDSCAPGQPAAGSAACAELQTRQQMRDASVDLMLATGAAAFLLGSFALLALAAGEPNAGVSVTAGAHGGGIGVLGTW